MKINYLAKICDVKMCLAKLKDGKGKELSLMKNKTFPPNIKPKLARNGDITRCP